MGADFWCWGMSGWFEGPGCCDISVIFCGFGGMGVGGQVLVGICGDGYTGVALGVWFG